MLYRSDACIFHHENNGRKFPRNVRNNTKLDSREERQADNKNVFMLNIERIQAEIKWAKVVQG
jgi:hypothetical protein